MDAFKIYIERFEKPVNWMVYDQTDSYYK